MAQLDWMMELDAELSDGDSVFNFVSSADIDTVLIHLFGISLHWKRKQSKVFTRPVYVWLQKQKPELYNISKIIESIERYFNKKYSAALIAIILSMGGNDFLPRHYGISYEKILMKAIDNKGLELFNSLTWKSKRQKRFVLSKDIHAAALSFDEVRQMTIKMPGKEFRHPQTWMPPESALRHLGSLIQAQIEFYLLLGVMRPLCQIFVVTLVFPCIQTVKFIIVLEIMFMYLTKNNYYQYQRSYSRRK
ncbi:hypothetical protein ACJMK2_026490 [Sinanodonta woodiana]|uniref:Uncharacterized protein n=1 Tax=Sinanodonta woodiana TaxID=1069815 RepID=A0ABD3XK50_SINWO